MATNQLRQIFQTLCGATLQHEEAGLTDGQLLERYVRSHKSTALAALVSRHAPMVWGVCRRVLRRHQDAEDAFQATFLVLVRKAASIVSKELVANWLYGVAHQTAVKARATTAKRYTREKQMTAMPEPATEQQEPEDDLHLLLDRELSRLPDKYRAVLVLCDLEGKTRKEAARHFRLPEGTVASRLATARTMLAKRLARQGLPVSGVVALAAVLAPKGASASVPSAVTASTIEAAALFAAGQATAPGVLSVKAVALAEGVLKTMLLTKLKIATALLLAVAFISASTAALTQRVLADKPAVAVTPQVPADKTADPPVNEKKATDLLVTVNKADDPLKAKEGPLGMKFVPLPKATFYMGGGRGKAGKKTEIKEEFEIAVYTVTQGQWQELMGNNPSWFSRGGDEDLGASRGKDKLKDIADEDLKQFPVENVSWHDARKFITKLNEQEKGKGWLYRLPTEAEWEYACRGGATSAEECSYDFYFTKPSNNMSPQEANCKAADMTAKGWLERTTKVGSYAPNRLGLYDMHGNVWQWCEDLFEPPPGSRDKAEVRVYRGGGWFWRADQCRAADRYGYTPDNRNYDVGFRLARVPTGGK